MRALAIPLLTFTLVAAEDPQQIVTHSLQMAERNAKLTLNYTFLERQVARTLDGQGRVTKTEIETRDVTLLDGSPYRRLVAREDKPLPDKEERKEQEKLRKITEQRQKETPGQRARRISDYAKKREREMEVFREAGKAFDFRLAGTEQLDGRDLYVIEATPKPGYQPPANAAKYFPRVRGKIWIDQKDYFWVKAEVEVIDTISLGAFLVRLAKGSRLAFEQTRVNNEVWLPKRVEAAASARVALVKKLRGDLEITYSNYRKFQTDSRIVSVSEPRP
jgi:hypothetical protein